MSFSVAYISNNQAPKAFSVKGQAFFLQHCPLLEMAGSMPQTSLKPGRFKQLQNIDPGGWAKQ